ncbi:MAG TPA: NRDE family protein [Bdellovibrionota bacterium]|nr:NRDE family protein [Bdellovibrionota bacterium]
MCVLFLSYRYTPGFKLVLAMNRDEHYGRPTLPAGFWPDLGILAGRDLEKGGTWLGMTQTGRIAALSNFRDPTRRKTSARTRGEITTRFLTNAGTADAYLQALRTEVVEYNDFNLILGRPYDGELVYFSSVTGEFRDLHSGIYGLSNHFLDSHWPKVTRGKAAFARALAENGRSKVSQAAAGDPLVGSLLELLRDDVRPADSALPKTGLTLQEERMVSPIYICSPSYGTVSSTVILMGEDLRVRFVEVTYGPDGEDGVKRYDFTLSNI